MKKLLSIVCLLFIIFSKTIPINAIDIWTVSSYENIFKDASKSISDKDSYNLVMVKNESESFQILLRNDKDFSISSVTFSDLKSDKGTIASSNITYNYVEYVYMKSNSIHQDPKSLIRNGEGYYPDPLSNEKTISVSANETQSIWITVSTPYESAAGLYTGTITINTSIGAFNTLLNVKVADITIPDAANANFRFMHHQQIAGTWFYDATPTHHPQDVIVQLYKYERWTPQWWELLEDMAIHLKKSRVNVLFVNTQQLLLDGGTSINNGIYTFNWSRFDEYIQFFLDKGGINAMEGIHFGSTIGAVGETYRSYILNRNNEGTMCSTNITPMENGCQTFYSQFIPALYKHLKEKGWLHMWIQHVGDEAVSDLQHEQYGYYMKILKQYAPDMQCGDPTFSLKSAKNAVAKGATIVTPIEELYQEYKCSFDTLRNQGVTVYGYNCCGPGNFWLNRFIDKPVWNQRSLGWLCYKWRLSGWLHWGWNFWVEWFQEELHTIDQEGFKGDHYSVYPDIKNNRIKGSIRMEAIRDMCEDYEILHILGQKDHKLALELVDMIANNASGNYTRDINKMIDTRNNLIEACEKYCK